MQHLDLKALQQVQDLYIFTIASLAFASAMRGSRPTQICFGIGATFSEQHVVKEKRAGVSFIISLGSEPNSCSA